MSLLIPVFPGAISPRYASPVRLFGLFLCLWLIGACSRPPDGPRPDDEPPTTRIEPSNTPTTAAQAPVAELEPTALSPSPTPSPSPTATRDPALVDWTLLVYIEADADLNLSYLQDLNEMEAAGQDRRVNVLVQVNGPLEASSDGEGGWRSRRYKVTGDDEPALLGSALLEEVDELPMEADDHLAQFLMWAGEHYPANRYGLIVRDRRSSATLDLTDSLQRLGVSGAVDHLDLITLDTGFTGQLPQLYSMAPYVDYVVASTSPVPAQSWNFRSLLEQLYAEPEIDGEALARLLAADITGDYADHLPARPVTMSVVATRSLAPLAEAVESLARELTANPDLMADTLQAARAGALVGDPLADPTRPPATVDLARFASILAAQAPSSAVRAAAGAVVEAVQAAVLGVPGEPEEAPPGIAVSLASGSIAGDAEATTLPVWSAFWESDRDHRLATADSPALVTNLVAAEPISVQQPAFLELEVAGRDLAHTVYSVVRQETDGRRRLLAYDYLMPEVSNRPGAGARPVWGDGVHETYMVWTPAAAYLADAAGNSGHVLAWPNLTDDRLILVAGRFRRAASADYVDARLVFDNTTGALHSVWQLPTAAGRPVELGPAAGDEFQLYDVYLNAADEPLYEEGGSLFFADEGSLTLSQRPLPTGAYEVYVAAINNAGQASRDQFALPVDNDNLVPGMVAYLDPAHGYQFLYPEDWSSPTTGTLDCPFPLVCARDRAEAIRLTITPYPLLAPGTDAAALKEETLAGYGPVSTLFERDIQLDGTPGLLTAYGYEATEGPHTGLFFTVVQDGAGYLVDLDGPTAAEATVVALMDQLIASWQFRPSGVGKWAGGWQTEQLAGMTVARPVNFQYEAYQGWDRFSSADAGFIAFKQLDADGRNAVGVVSAYLDEAAQGVAGFEAVEPVLLSLSGNPWVRSDFSYLTGGGETVRGFITAAVAGEEILVAWAEAPAAAFDALDADIFQVMVADLRPLR